MENEKDTMTKKQIDKEEGNAHDVTQYSDNNQTINTFISFQRNSKRKGTGKSEITSKQPRPATSKSTQSQKKLSGTRNKSSKHLSSFNSTKDSVNEFKQSYFSRLPRMQQIIEHNKQTEIERKYKEMRKGNLNKDYPIGKHSKLNRLIYNQFFNLDFSDLNKDDWTIYPNNQNDNFFTTNKN